MGSKHPTHLASEQKWLGLGVWLELLQASFGCQRGKGRCYPFHNGLSKNESEHLCVWFWSEELGLCHTNALVLSQSRETF